MQLGTQAVARNRRASHTLPPMIRLSNCLSVSVRFGDMTSGSPFRPRQTSPRLPFVRE